MSDILKGVIRKGPLLFLFLFPFSAFSFDGIRAFHYIEEQCALGTREPGSPGHAAMKNYLEQFLIKQKGHFSKKEFTFQDKKRNKSLALTNFHLFFPGQDKKKLLLCAHYDCRPWAEPGRRNLPIPGANDGGSGVAVLMELCHSLSKKAPGRSVEIVFFDGEDYGFQGDDNWCLGSKHFAQQANPKDYAFAILLDMVGDKDLHFLREGNSLKQAPQIMERIWKSAEQLQLPAFSTENGPYIYDDHIPLQKIGIPAVDLIDFDYPYWHTLSDTPDKCSDKSLSQVGQLLIELIYGQGQ